MFAAPLSCTTALPRVGLRGRCRDTAESVVPHAIPRIMSESNHVDSRRAVVSATCSSRSTCGAWSGTGTT
ncbi:Uncharacterised protein [Mycobacteroides abscessus]|nr:Uncharacterised protein [Mycobacteroides abscessus]